MTPLTSPLDPQAEDSDASGEWLDPVSAAVRLGVSPELLFQYARRDTSSVSGSFRLGSSTKSGRTLFLASDVDEFDVRLHEPRSAPGELRARVDAAVTAHLKVEAGGGCARCGSGVAVENAHIVPYSETRSNHHRNLIRLCSACHGEFDSGVLERTEVAGLKLQLTQAGRERLLAGSGIVVRDLPTRHPLFGRAEELATLVPALQTERSIVVRGIGGIGKTQLVLHAVSAAQTGRPLLWISLEDCSSEAVLMAYVGAAADRVASGELIPGLSSVRACVVLDGVERAGCGIAVVSKLISSLTADGLDIQVVVTSQARLPEIRFDTDLPVGRLDAEASAAILQAPAEGAGAPFSLLDFADGHPLALRIIAALVRHFDSPSLVNSRLRANPERPLEMPARQIQNADSSLDACLQVAFEALTEKQRSAMWALSQLPAGLATTFVSLESLGFDGQEEVVADLRRWHLVEERELWGGSLLSVLSPVRDYIRRAVSDGTMPDIRALRQRLALAFATNVEDVDAIFLHGGRIETGMQLLDRELPNVLAIVALATRQAHDDHGFGIIATSIAARIQTYLFSAGHFDVGAEVMRKAADLSIAAGRTIEALEMLSQLVSLANRGGRTDVARVAIEDARALAFADDPMAKALMLGLESDLERPAGDETPLERRERLLTAAATAGRSFELLMEAFGGQLTHRASQALLQQACLLEDAGRPQEALPLLDRALEHFRTAKDPINAGSALQRRGNCLAYVERLDEAMESYAESAELFHRLAAVEYRSNALGEAGLLLGEHRQVTCSPKITPDILLGGIDDIVDRIVEAIPAMRVPGNDWPYVLTRKSCGMIILASLAGQPACLAHMGLRLREEVADALSRREPEEWQAVGGASLVTAHFAALAWLCEHLAEVQPPDARPGLSEVEGLAIVVEDMFSGDMRDTMFGWLARYLSERRGLTGLSSGRLRAAVDGLGYGDPFELDGFSFPGA